MSQQIETITISQQQQNVVSLLSNETPINNPITSHDNIDNYNININLVTNTESTNSNEKLMKMNNDSAETSISNTDTTTSTTTTTNIVVPVSLVHDNITSSSNTTSTTTTKNTGGTVSFGTVRVREHRMTLGRNPGIAGDGVPVELAWDIIESNEFNTIDDYEEEKINRYQSHDNINNNNTSSTTVSTGIPHPQEHQPTSTATVNIISTNQDETVTNLDVNVDYTTTTNNSTQPSVTLLLEPNESDTTKTVVTVVTPTKRYVKLLTASKREEIASRHHSRDSIIQVQNEIRMIQEHRNDAKSDIHAKRIILNSKGIQTSPPSSQPQKSGTDNIMDTILQQHQERKLQESINLSTTANSNKVIAKKQKSWWSYCCP